MTPFTLDTTVSAPTEQTAVATPTNDATPNVVIKTSEAGTITVGGTRGCGLSSSASVPLGVSTVTLSMSGGDKEFRCTIIFIDAAGNQAGALTLSPFALDTTAPTATEQTPVVTPTNDPTPNVVIQTSEAGMITVGGTAGCGLSSSASVPSGASTVTLALSGYAVADKEYKCTMTFTDAAGNTSPRLALSPFVLTILTEQTPVQTPTKHTTPNVVISSREAGKISVGGTAGCGLSSSASMPSGVSTVTLSASGGDKEYRCTITFTDAGTHDSKSHHTALHRTALHHTAPHRTTPHLTK